MAHDAIPVNLPNVLCIVRLTGSLGLIGLAIANQPLAFVILFLVLFATDLIDGRLAVWLREQTRMGAWLDSLADRAMYGGLLFGSAWLRPAALGAARLWIAAAVMTFVISCTVSLAKYHRLPSHHTYSAKLAAALTVFAAVALLLDWVTWPIRAAAIAISCANLESALITLLSDHWQSDVSTVWQAIHSR